MRLGVLDVGSNTVHLLVVDARRGGHPTPMSSTKAALRLAESMDASGKLTRKLRNMALQHRGTLPLELLLNRFNNCGVVVAGVVNTIAG